MKKIMFIVITICMAISLVGCNKKKTTSVPRNTVDILESDLETQMCNVAEFLDDATFCVLNYSSAENEEASSLGSGVVYKREINDNNSYTYYLVTNRHVIESGEKFKVYSNDESTTTANRLGYSETYDIGVLTFTSYTKYNVVPFAEEETIKKGAMCFAMGTPLYLQYVNTFTKGNVSNISSDVVQHTADINAGNSGGPLVNLNGELIGINTSKLSTQQEGKPDIDGMYMAVKVDKVEKAIDEIEGKNKAILSPILGLTVTDVRTIKTYDYDTFDDLWEELKDEYVSSLVARGFSLEFATESFNDNYASERSGYLESYNKYHAYNVYIDSSITKGMLIRNVVLNSPSDTAGVEIGDVVTKINDIEITNQTDFSLEF
ncbi:MAG: S1C family serine protease, partial [bacterium]|nr:S1C family serine protease [bacterium]